jgi:chemotaxis protein MotA
MKSFTGLLGYLFVGIFFYFALMKTTDNPALFFNVHGIAIVFGGLLVAGLASFPWSLLKQTLMASFRALNTTSRIDPEAGRQSIELCAAYVKNMTAFEKVLEGTKHPFVKQGGNLVLEGLNKEFVIQILEKRIEEHRQRIQAEMNVLLTLSKYSPAMGLAATVLGLVNLLEKLATADMGQLGAGMAIALTGTFFGIMLSNMLFAPLSELIASAGDIEIKEQEMIQNAFDLMMDKRNPVVIGEFINSYLPESDRTNFLEQSGKKEAA